MTSVQVLRVRVKWIGEEVLILSENTPVDDEAFIEIIDEAMADATRRGSPWEISAIEVVRLTHSDPDPSGKVTVTEEVLTTLDV